MALRLELAATRVALLPRSGTTHLRVTVMPTMDAPNPSRQPIALALVVDRSGSMNDMAGPRVPFLWSNRHRYARYCSVRSYHPRERRTKMSVTRDAAERLVDAMSDGDQLALISFSDVAQLDLPLTPPVYRQPHDGTWCYSWPSTRCYDESA